MKLLTIFFIFISFSLLATSYQEGDSIPIDDREAIKQILKLYKMHKEKGRELGGTDRGVELQQETCVSCNEILNLGGDLNNILQYYSFQNPEYKDVLIESNKLQAVYKFTQMVDEDNNIKCIENHLNIGEDIPFDKLNSEYTLVFTRGVPNRFQSAMFEDPEGEKTIVWLRDHSPDSDKIIRVITDRTGKAQVDFYYREEQVVEEDEKTESLSLAYEYESDPQIPGKLKVKVGLDLEYEYYIPKKLTIFNIDSEESIGTLKVHTNITIDSKHQGAFTEVIDEETNSSVRLDIDKSGTHSINGQFEIELWEGYHIANSAALSSDESHSYSAAIMAGDGRTILDSKLSVDDKGNRKILVKREMELNKGSSLIVEYQKSESDGFLKEDNESVFIRYSIPLQ